MEKKEIILNNTFSSERFGLLAKSDFLINKGNYIKFIIAVIGVFVAIAVLVSINAISSINELTDTSGNFGHEIELKKMTFSQIYLTISIWVISLGMTVLGSLTFCNLSSKKRRISTFMIPASLFEKFILRILIYIILGSIVLMIGYLLGIGIIELSFGGVHEWLKTAKSLLIVLDVPNVSGLLTTIGILWALFGMSLYVLGSSLWPRLSWVKTWMIITVLQWIFAIIFIVGIFSGFDFEDFITKTIISKGFLWTVISILSVFTVACWTIAWWRFSNTQIVQRFMKK